MKKKILKRIGLLILVGTMITGNVYSVAASSILDEVESTETNADHAEDISYSLLRGNNLNFGKGEITRISSNEVSIYGLTQCHRECSNVYLDMALEWKVDGDYATYKMWEFSAEDVTELERSMVVIVPSGHYYRLRGYHAAVNGGYRESTETLTSGILVN